MKKCGVQVLKSCALDEVIDIRKTGLDILSHLCRTRPDAAKIVVEIGVLETCLDYIKKYPSEAIDPDVLCNCLDLVSEFIHPSSKSLDGLLK